MLELWAAAIIVFVLGYIAAWWRYNVAPVHIVVRKETPLPPLATPIADPGPGSERFHTGGDDGPLDNDHDNQVISRMRK